MTLILEIAAGMVLGWVIIVNFKTVVGLAIILALCGIVLGAAAVLGLLVYGHWDKIAPWAEVFGVVMLGCFIWASLSEIFDAFGQREEHSEIDIPPEG